MSLPLFLRGLVGVLVVFAIATYLFTGSVWTTLVNTIVCAILLQVGYFAAVLYLVWRTPPAERPERGLVNRDSALAAPKEEQPAANIGGLPTRPTTPSSPHP
jgi:exopolysaccharide production repressor protein